ncbi:amidohydrolase family protein [Nitrospira moscoviensis]|uniref:Putative Amidohydrolase n=1 Tax=Nitrospira moscoviensis TaxID=42253 RepID=A0A0K2GA91_NITMO|nr:amidohydrolase family protein [Nitrospira moscoviensis]ALA57502.1 putative Amidohydrolase [Nitrospira moscoviensis]
MSETTKRLIDCHVHLAALPDGGNGCYISAKMLKSPLFRFLLWKHGLDPQKPGDANRKYLDDLLQELRASRHVRQAVLLGMDGVYDTSGRLVREHTDFLISNDYVLQTAKTYPNEFLAGVSINPQRRDAVEEVHRCAEAGATLVKVLPNAQQFNPADPKYKPFYRALAEHKLPFLSHVGYEFSLIGKDQSVGDPDRLKLALDEGTTVIAAHACSYGLILYEKFIPTLHDFVARYPHFYADISALTLPNRFRMLLHLRKHPEIHERLLFGTDYPLSVFHVAAWGRVAFGTLRDIIRTKNRFDRQVEVCERLNVKFRSFGELFSSP